MTGAPAGKSTTTRLGSYEVLQLLARGGMAELFLARSVGPQGFEKVVVLKKILPHFSESARFVRLFLDEAKLVAALDHPHIAQVYDMGLVDGHYFFTMEYVHGQDVRSILHRSTRDRRPFPVEHAVQVARNIAAALHYAHERRGPDGMVLDIVHRDVSPSNILVSYDGGVKLLDFGVAKAANSSMKTRTGALKGKAAYMSPEQGRGAAIDRRSDIYSLGIVLWEMVTGRRLYKADNDLATIQKILHEPPAPPSTLRPDCPPELEAIVLRALAQTLEDRYQTAQQLQRDLEEFAREHRLGQSSIELSNHMQALFSAEIRAWKDAQSSGVTLTDHVIAVAADPTHSRSDEELSQEIELVDPHEDDDDEPSASEMRGSALTPVGQTEPTAQVYDGPVDALEHAAPIAGESAWPLERISFAPAYRPVAVVPEESRSEVKLAPPRRMRWIVGLGVLVVGLASVIGVGMSGDEPAPVRPDDSRVAPGATVPPAEPTAEPPATVGMSAEPAPVEPPATAATPAEPPSVEPPVELPATLTRPTAPPPPVDRHAATVKKPERAHGTTRRVSAAKPHKKRDRKRVDKKRVELKPVDRKPVDRKLVETAKPAKPADPKPADPKPVDPKPADPKPVDTKPFDPNALLPPP